MHNLIDFICEELEELEKKAERDGKLSMAEIQYADTLAHTKKNLLKGEEMMEEGFSMAGDRYHMGSYARGGNMGGRSYARGGRRMRGANQYGSYAMEGYSRGEDMVMELRELMNEAPDERTRKEFEHFIRKIEHM